MFRVSNKAMYPPDPENLILYVMEGSNNFQSTSGILQKLRISFF